MRFCVYLSISFIMSSCFTPSKEKTIRRDIATLEAKITKLETDSRTVPQTQGKSIASTQTDLDKTRQEVRFMQGEIDRLIVGVRTGELPGDQEAGQSISKSVAELDERISTVEANQAAILELLEKAIGKSGSQKTSSKTPSIKSVSELENAFQAKRYMHVANSASSFMKAKNRNDREKATFLNAESLFKLGRIQDAALAFNDYIDKFPESKNAAHARMRLGDSFRFLGDKETSKSFYKEVVAKHSGTEEAKRSAERLEKL
jgi:TolA-binding protein